MPKGRFDKVKALAKRGINRAINEVRAARARRPFERGRIIAAPSGDTDAVRLIAVGRQGYDEPATFEVARTMERVAAESPTHAVLQLGDNFFPAGVFSLTDLQWQLKFEYVYDGPHLRGLPFFAVLGNHDHLGKPDVQIDYARQKRGTGRWTMDDRYYARDFGRVPEAAADAADLSAHAAPAEVRGADSPAAGRVLLRVVFLDTVPLLKDPAPQIEFARDAFAAPGDPVWRVIAGHAAGRSLSKIHTAQRALTPWLSDFIAMQVDAFLSADDWFQAMIDYDGEPLSVSTNGGATLNEKDLIVSDPAREFIASAPGFATIMANRSTLAVELRDIDGRVVCVKRRSKTIP